MRLSYIVSFNYIRHILLVVSHLFVFMGQFLRIRLQRRYVLILCQVKNLNGVWIWWAGLFLLILFLICAIFSSLQRK